MSSSLSNISTILHPLSGNVTISHAGSKHEYFSRLLQLGLQAMNLANNITTHPDFRPFLRTGTKAKALPRGLPPLIKFGFASSSGSGQLIGRLILDLFIRRL